MDDLDALRSRLLSPEDVRTYLIAEGIDGPRYTLRVDYIPPNLLRVSAKQSGKNTEFHPVVDLSIIGGHLAIGRYQDTPTAAQH